MRIKEQKYLLPDGREVTIKSAGPEDAMKVKLLDNKGAIVKVKYIMKEEEEPDPKQITAQKWQKTVNRLYSDLHVHEWKKNYIDPDVLDGTQWHLDIRFTNSRKRSYYGSNDFPPYWNELVKIFREFVKL